MTRLSPVELECLLAFFYLAYPTQDWVGTVPARQSAEDYMENIRAIEGNTVTPLGRAWVEEILHTPIPTLAYVNAQGKVIKC